MDYCLAGDDGTPAIWNGQPDLDLNGDGRLDAIGLDFDGDGMHDDALADLDGDGHIDLVVCNYFQDGAAVFDVNGRRPERMHDSMSRAANGGGGPRREWCRA